MNQTIHPYAIASGDYYDFNIVVKPRSLDASINLNASTLAVRPETIAARKIIHGDKTSLLVYKCELLYPKYHLSEGHVLDSKGRLVDHAGRPLRMNYGFLVDNVEEAEKILHDDGILKALLEKSKQAIEPHVYNFIPKLKGTHETVHIDPLLVEALPNGKQPDHVIVHEDFHVNGESKVAPTLPETKEDLSELDEYLNQQKESKKKMPAEDADISSHTHSNGSKNLRNRGKQTTSNLNEEIAKESKATKSFPVGKIVGTTVLGIVFADGVRRLSSRPEKKADKTNVIRDRFIGAMEMLAGGVGITLIWWKQPIEHFFANAVSKIR